MKFLLRDFLRIISDSFTSRFIPHRPLATRTPDSWNSHESFALSAEDLMIILFIE